MNIIASANTDIITISIATSPVNIPTNVQNIAYGIMRMSPIWKFLLYNAKITMRITPNITRPYNIISPWKRAFATTCWNCCIDIIRTSPIL